jgi:hypothetical protein
MNKLHCHICFSSNIDQNMVCDICEQYYCEECSYTFTIHYQHQGARCFQCSDQQRIKPLSKENIRNNKLKIWI